MHVDEQAKADDARRLVRWIAAAAALPMLLSVGYAAYSVWTMAAGGHRRDGVLPRAGQRPG